MKLTGILAAALLAAPGVGAAQAHGGMAIGPGHAGAGSIPMGNGPGAHAGAAQVDFRGDGADNHRGDHDRFHHHHDFAALYPYWGWSGCAPSGDCDWDEGDPPGVTPADYVDPPAAPARYAAAAAPAHRAIVNECSDWVWRPDLGRSVCKRPYRG